MFELTQDFTLKAYTRIVEEMVDEDLADEMAHQIRNLLYGSTLHTYITKQKLQVLINEHEYRNQIRNVKNKRTRND